MRAGTTLLVMAALLLGPVVLLWSFQRRLIDLPFPRTVVPAGSVLPGASEVSFATPDGLRLGGRFLPASGRRVGPAVLVGNGNGEPLDAGTAGGRDRIVPAEHSRRLFAAAPQPKRLVVLDGADHNDHDLLAGPRLLAELRAFVAAVPGLLA